MKCAVCQKACRVQRHNFCEGAPDRPVRIWHIDAPQYFKATDDGMGCAAPFCGALYATTYFREMAA